MKKIFTMILVAAGTISFASAQSYNQKVIAYNDNKKMSNDRDDHNAFDKTKTLITMTATFLQRKTGKAGKDQP